MRSDPKNKGKGKCEFSIQKRVIFCLCKGEEKQTLLETYKLCCLWAAAANQTGFPGREQVMHPVTMRTHPTLAPRQRDNNSMHAGSLHSGRVYEEEVRNYIFLGKH